MSAIHHLILTLLFVVVGCCVGSFVNVCASRIPRGLSVLRPRSHCPRCRTTILARDNIPVFGWLTLRGQCRACGTAIPPRYLLVELAMGCAFGAVYLTSVFLAPGDFWEQQGAVWVFGRLLIFWTATSVVVTSLLTALDIRAKSV
jgi:leader peptidase (prepilin peptidase)/N-methyltransferase